VVGILVVPKVVQGTVIGGKIFKVNQEVVGVMLDVAVGITAVVDIILVVIHLENLPMMNFMDEMMLQDEILD
jgi:hypothetical protein